MTLSASLNGAEQRRPSRLGRLLEDRLRYLIVAPAILILLLVGLFPLIYSLIVSFQRITMTENNTSFVGLLNYAELFRDARLWVSLGHTAIITAIALPLELLIGFLMAQLFIDRMPGRQLFVALLVLPTVISPIVAGATWRLMFDVRFGPIGEILSFFAGEPVRILWTVNPAYVYPAIIICEVWQWSPFMFLLLLAALSNVDQSQLEAAEIDGASYLRVLRAIILPAIAPVIAVDTAAISFLVIAVLTRSSSLWSSSAWSLRDEGRQASGEKSPHPGASLSRRRRRDPAVSVSGLLALHDFVQDAGRDLPCAALVDSRSDPVLELLRPV
ncbi:sugar ABC transporter permease [Bradyrhizobium sp. ISRA426]|nr:sugar ABC transporter permease [Bradyrhizobium sp. ISRA426]WGR69689.1 sugar ABC transporter permease [Bradyrhizobium sp. ISRA426]